MTKTMKVFCYGSLMADEVLQALLGRVPVRRPARLRGYRRFQAPERTYPGVVEAPGSDVDGIALLGIEQREAEILDDFEGDEYAKKTVEVDLIDDAGETVAANVYVFLNNPGERPWDYQEFREKHLQSFLQMTSEYIEEEKGKERGIGSLY